MVSIYNAKYYNEVALSIPGYQEIIDRIIQIVDKKSYYTILDIGAGTGRTALKLANKVFKIVAVDTSKGTLEKLYEKLHKKHINNIQIVKKDITNYAFLWPITNPILSDCAFNSTICNFVLHHINNKWKKIVLEKLRDSLISDGIIVISDINVKRRWKVKKLGNRIYWDLIKKKENRYPVCFIFKQMISYLFFEHSLSEERWIGLLNEIGFSEIKVETFDNFILVWVRR